MIIIAVEIWCFLGSEDTYFDLLLFISPCALLCRYQCNGGTHYHHLLIPYQTTECSNPYNHDIFVLKLTSLKYTCFCGSLAGIVWYYINVIMNMLMKQNIPQKCPYLNVYNDRKFIPVDCTWWTVRKKNPLI